MTPPTPVRIGALLCAAFFAASCSSDSGVDNATGVDDAASPIVAQVASYDLTPDRPQRVIVGLLDNDNNVVSFGDVEFAFSYLGTADEPLETPVDGPTATADFRLIPGQDVDPEAPGPRVGEPVDGAGVYAADDVEFTEAGIWEVTVTADLPEGNATASANFEVLADSDIPNVGDDAPRTENLLLGDPDAPVAAVDSRAEPDGTVPDPELHSETVAQAIAAGRPALVVVSTPTFCVSRFCGPITDSVSNLAADVGDDVAFIHIEVWRDYENTVLNQGAADWIWPDEEGDDIHEPWVFLVDADGTIVERWDNVATDAEMQAAVEQVRS